MTKKIVTFRNAPRRAAALAAAEPACADAPMTVDRWVHRSEESVGTTAAASVKPEAAPRSLTISIPAEPDWFEVVKIWFALPYLTFSFWTLAAAQRNARYFAAQMRGDKDIFE